MRAKQGFLVLKDGRCSCRRYSEAMKLLKAMATVGGLTGLSRIAGFVRDILTASILGAGPIADAFFVALKLPNFLRRRARLVLPLSRCIPV
jgi:hypothetical protein